MGDAPARYGPMVGSGTFLPRLALAELHLERGEIAEARSALEWCVENHPEFLAVAGPYASALLARRRRPRRGGRRARAASTRCPPPSA